MMEISKTTNPKVRTHADQARTDDLLFYTVVDFLAALFFVIGSLLFFQDATYIPGVWMYLLGSIGFGVKPSITLIKRFQAWRAAQQRPNLD